MKRLFLLLGGLIILAGCGMKYKLQPENFMLSQSGKRIAVLPLADLREAKIKNKYISPGDVIREKLIAGLSNKNFQVVDRENLDKIITEQKLSLSGMIDKEQAVEIGKLAGVELIMIGSINRYQRTIYPKAVLQMTIKILDTQTGLVVKAQEVDVVKSNWFYPLELMKDVVEVACLKTLESVQ